MAAQGCVSAYPQRSPLTLCLLWVSLSSQVAWCRWNLCPPGIQNAGSILCVSVRDQSRLTLCDPMDCNLPGSSILGIIQARVLEWVAISFSRGSSPSRDWTHISCIGRRIFYHWGTREPRFWLFADLCDCVPSRHAVYTPLIALPGQTVSWLLLRTSARKTPVCRRGERQEYKPLLLMNREVPHDIMLSSKKDWCETV